jgi:two-component system OmpR family response regulator
VLRRTQNNQLGSNNDGLQKLKFAGWVLDMTARHLIAPDDMIVSLSGAEYRMLNIFSNTRIAF